MKLVTSMRLARLGLSIVFGAVVTFGLFVVMSVLIAPGDTASADSKIQKIADIWQSDRIISDQIKALTPEKPDTPVEPPPDLPDLKMDVAPTVGAVSMAAPNMDALKIGLGGSFARDSDYIPIYVPQPDYPPMARRRGISGYAVIEVTITETGGVRDPKLIEEYPENKGFGKYALRAAKKLKYKPRVVDGVAEEVPGVFYKFSFQMAN
ncbi:MAG: energy transducer TonB [Porticoccus sp.]